MRQKEIPGSKRFWDEEAELDMGKETFLKSAMMINHFLNQNCLELIEVASSSLTRAVQTAQGTIKHLLIKSEWVNYSNDSGSLTPQIQAWESLMQHFPASVENTSTMYASGSEAKGLLMAEGYKLLEYIKNCLKGMKSGTAKIIVTHSPIIEALESAATNRWNEWPGTIAKGSAIALIFDEQNKLVGIERLEIAFTGP